MTNLTEQWKKGELPEGYYYVKDGENMIAEYLDGYFYNNGEPMTSFSGGVDEVLAPVPSYDEWKAAQEQLHKEGIWYTEISHKKVLKENAELKELLKECQSLFNRATVEGAEPNNAELIEILTKIEDVLK
jgi:hypothetical protein